MSYLIFILGVIVGTIVVKMLEPKNIGGLRVDHSDPDSPYVFLEASIPMDEIQKHKRVILDVKIQDYLPRK